MDKLFYCTVEIAMKEYAHNPEEAKDKMLDDIGLMFKEFKQPYPHATIPVLIDKSFTFQEAK